MARILAKQHEGLHWKVNRKSPGNSFQGTAVFQCNSHLNCPRLLRVALIRGVYYIQVRGDHSTEVNLYARSNLAQTRRVRSTSRRGCSLGSILVASQEVSIQP